MRNDEIIRKVTIKALSSNDEIFERLVLKGGNVLSMVYGLNSRASSDLDYSMSGTLSEVEQNSYKTIIEKALNKAFLVEKMVMFDFSFREKPKNILDRDLAAFWGGYCIEFKVISKDKFDALDGKIEDIRRQAIPVVESGSTKMKVDISKFEYVGQPPIKEIEGYAIKVYSPELVVCEKLRAICQQMPEYLQIIRSQKPTPRPRDFFDIYYVTRQWPIDFSDEDRRTTLKLVFDAKKVPLSLLSDLGKEETYKFHESAFKELEAVVEKSTKLESFLFYFDYTKNLIKPILENLSE